MTRKLVPAVCDLCAKDVVTEMKYTMQISQKGGGRGKFIKCDNSADMCHNCFLEMCKNGFKPKWVTLIKNPQSGKWDVQDPQQKLEEPANAS